MFKYNIIKHGRHFDLDVCVSAFGYLGLWDKGNRPFLVVPSRGFSFLVDLVHIRKVIEIEQIWDSPILVAFQKDDAHLGSMFF